MSELSEFFKLMAEEKKRKEEAERNSPAGKALAAVQQRLKENNEMGDLLEVFVEGKKPGKTVVVEKVVEKEVVVEKVVEKEVVNKDSFQQPAPQPIDMNLEAFKRKLQFLEQAVGKIAATGPGGGEVNLKYLDDVDRSSIGDGKYLNYNATTKKFQFSTLSAGATQLQSDWSQADNTALDFIKNKPSFVTDLTSVDNTVQISTNGDGVHDLSVAASLSTSVDKVFAYVTNDDTVTIHKGDPVFLYRATGNRPSVILARNTSDAYSAKTLGLASQDITPGNPGWVQTQGVLTGVNTQAYSEGDTLYLGATAGTLTNVKPHSPNHLVYMGVVVRANQGQGQIYIKPQNGYELEELHNVNIDHLVALADGQVLSWSASDNQWVNKELDAITWTSPTPGPASNFKTLLQAHDGYASISILDGVPPYLNVHSWKFDKTKLTFPDLSEQTTAWTGAFSYNDLSDKPTLFSGSYADLTNKPTIPTVPTLVSAFTNDSGYLTSVTWNQVSDKPQNILTLNDTNVVSNEMLVNDSITIGGTSVALGGSITSLTGLTGVTSNAATAFIAGENAASGVALQMPNEGALRNLTNGFNNMYFDVSNGGTAHGAFQFRSSNGYTNVLTMSPTVFSVNTGATVTARTSSLARTGFNSAIDTEITVDEMRFRISNQGGIFPQVIGNGSSRNLAWTGVGAISGTAVTQVGSTGTIVSTSAWTTLYNAHGMDSAGDTITVTLQDKAGGRIYRITFMRSDNGSTTGYNIIAERLL